MSTHRPSRSRDVSVAATSNKRPKTEGSRWKSGETDQLSTVAQPAILRRKKSRSPSIGRSRPDPFIAATTAPPKAQPSHSVKRKKSTMHLSQADVSGPESAPDRGHRMRATTPALAPVKHRQKKENSGGKDKDAADMQTSVYSSALAMADFERQKEKLKREVDTLRKELHENKKTIKKQQRQIENLKVENNTGQLARKDQEAQLDTLRSKTQKADNVISTVESALQCQICMEMLLKPFALSPCGHILCLPCLQEWFRKAPPSADDMDIDPEDFDDPQYIMNRQKSCPCCRATVLHRPVPVFLVKSVVTTLIKAKGPGHTAASPVSRGDGTSTVDADDPWEGLFPEDDDMVGMGDDDYEFDEDAPYMPWVLGALGDESDDGYDSYASAEGDSMDEDDGDEDDEDMDSDEEGFYVSPIWERPTVYYRGGSRHDPTYIKMVRRGCSREMIQAYGMTYSHTAGLVVYVRSLDPDAEVEPFRDADRADMIRVYVGYNVRRDADDRAGHGFVNGILEEFRHRPQRFTAEQRAEGAGWDIKMLVRVRDVEELSDGDTTSSEAWHDTLR